MPWARVLPGLRLHSDTRVAAGIDWPRLLDRLARGDLPRRWPQRQKLRWPEPLVLVLDVSERLAQYRHDFQALAQRIHAHLAGSSLSIRTLPRGPANAWQPWQPARRVTPAVPLQRRQDPQAWRLPPGSTVIVASDLGALEPVAGSALNEQWLVWGRALRAQGARLVALAPVSPASLPAQMLATFTVLRWSADSRWLREQLPQSEAAVDIATDGDSASAIGQLLALGATALRIDPPLLRAWSRLLAPGGDASLEGRFWNHPDVQRHALCCAIRPDRLDHHLAAYAHLRPDLRKAAHQALQTDHAHLRRSFSLAEGWRHATAVLERGDRARLQDSLAGLLHRTRQWVTLDAAGRQAVLQSAQLIQSTVVERVRALDPALFAELDAFVASQARPQHMPELVPGEWVWCQVGENLVLRPAAADAAGRTMGAPFLPGPARELSVRDGSHVRVVPLAAEGVALALREWPGVELHVALGRRRWVLRQQVVPGWVEEASVQQGGALSLAHTAPNGQRIEWPADAKLALTVLSEPETLKLSEDDFGLFADVTLSGPHPLTVRLRYLPPGRFQMGSTGGVGDSDEHPQHEVLLTEGFWLADTPCTQALWMAVMGKNPSEFQRQPGAAEYPVENVSWDDVQTFLRRLTGLLPAGCQPTLPTEAQWEYAARAGAATAYWWGDEPDDQRANWGGQQKGTTPVNRYPPNPWGLYDMHGNVWEWCLDDQRDYTSESIRDPLEAFESYDRAVRGGSWIGYPGRARSAYRLRWHRGFQNRDLGFRFALRSPSRPVDRLAGGIADVQGRYGRGGK
ncbi:MAG TPA: formylglycine-generating enzyme family protein [Burkholderiaceae bacterium]|nr:formylglycine-generating enzyme family protein [Burkholderiaceae bacterium]